MFVLAVATFACRPAAIDDPSLPSVIYEPSSAAFWDRPWPADERLEPDGTLDLAGFPISSDPILETYLARAAEQTGFSTNGAIYLQLDGPVDPLAMPRELQVDGANLILVDVDPRSAHRGERTPVTWEQGGPGTALAARYVPEHLLAVAPWEGYPLRPATTYALIATRQLLQRHEDWASRLDRRSDDHDPDLVDAIAVAGLDVDDVAIATVFTTTDPIGELAAVAEVVRHELAPADLDDAPLRWLEDRVAYTAYETDYATPRFTDGVPPYAVEGGGFRYGVDGAPEVVAWDRVRTAVCVPPGAPPPGGWPVLVYQHGTGGDYRTFCDSDAALEVMTRMGAEGIVGIGIDQTLHGTRPGAEEASDLTHFNVTNPDSGVTNFRQGAIDLVYLARSLAERPQRFVADDGRRVTTDPSRVLFMGHSQGGITGAMAAPFVGEDVRAMVLSGAGAVLSITLVERKDPVDLARFVRLAAGLSDDDALTPLHPVLTLVQTLVEPTDPANYARYWFAESGTWSGQRSVPVLVTSGTADRATPPRTAIALATAGHVPFVGTPASAAPGLVARVGEATALPVADNVVGFDGRTITAGFHQWRDGAHGVLFRRPEASDVYVNLLVSAARGEAVLRSP